MEKMKAMDSFDFESRESYEQACEESGIIQHLLEEVDVTDVKNALRVYNHCVAKREFHTISGYFFLVELRQRILESGLVSERALAPIPIKEPANTKKDVVPERTAQERRFRRLYENEKLLNKKLKVILAALLVLLVGFIFINFRFEYTIFTYFTNYKANMEEELIDKYEKWESELQQRENSLLKNGNQ